MAVIKLWYIAFCSLPEKIDKSTLFLNHFYANDQKQK